MSKKLIAAMKACLSSQIEILSYRCGEVDLSNAMAAPWQPTLPSLGLKPGIVDVQTFLQEYTASVSAALHTKELSLLRAVAGKQIPHRHACPTLSSDNKTVLTCALLHNLESGSHWSRPWRTRPYPPKSPDDACAAEVYRRSSAVLFETARLYGCCLVNHALSVSHRQCT
jgi:hypothetical protein